MLAELWYSLLARYWILLCFLVLFVGIMYELQVILLLCLIFHAYQLEIFYVTLWYPLYFCICFIVLFNEINSYPRKQIKPNVAEENFIEIG